MKRQTGLCLEDICAYLERNRMSGNCGACHGAGTPYPPCLLANELGVIAADEHNKEAEAKLRDIAEWSDVHLRGIAYFYLVMIASPEEETANAIVAFGARPENQGIMKQVDEEFRKRILGN